MANATGGEHGFLDVNQINGAEKLTEIITANILEDVG